MFRRTASAEQVLHTVIRELDRRKNDGIEVALLWNARTDQVLVSVVDEFRNEAFQFEVAGRDAVEAFQHPYAFAPPDYNDAALAA